MLVVRKLGHVLQGLNLLEDQGTVEGFFSNVENADKLAGLVEDVRDAVMDYQVCDQSNDHSSISDTPFRLSCNKTSITRAANLL